MDQPGPCLRPDSEECEFWDSSCRPSLEEVGAAFVDLGVDLATLTPNNLRAIAAEKAYGGVEDALDRASTMECHPPREIKATIISFAKAAQENRNST